ncbi:hypothetical protein PGTUg99_007090 [Puccinia graminis f. sp. tritici]|uniref:Uncharacterized protein n=1 Tax=Puccinia graminis f. sp. tritici TaxID=56615 RepID=A0A5B0PV54_PUCGR|nr:hypothetical protein PGTUg99_007090 [Puccinia graminis f. sp. tritici]
MTAVRAPNHPAYFNGHFQPISDSIAESVRANQYGYVKTPSFFQCAGSNSDKNEDFEVELVTNTALTNTLHSDSIYALSGKIIALNNGSTPVLSYIQDTVIRIGTSGPNQPDFSNKSVVTSLGMVVSRREIANQSSDSATQLEVIVAHCDWDGEERVHRRFNIKYLVPGTKNLVKTHTLYQVGREVNIIGRLVDFHMDDNIAVVVVSSVSITSGHQIGRANQSSPGPSTGSPIQGRKFTKFFPKSALPASSSVVANNVNPKLIKPTVGPETRGENKPSPQQTPDKSSKGKSKAIDHSESEEDDASEETSEEEGEVDVQVAVGPSAKRGRPRKSIIQEAVKRMKKH